MTVEKEYFNDDNYGDGTLASKHERTRNIAAELPDYFPNGRGSGHYNLLYPVGEQVAQLEHDILTAANAQRIQNAETKEQLSKLGEMFNLPPEENEDIERYRARLLAESQIATGEGTPSDLIDAASVILDIDSSKIIYSEPIAGSAENGTVSMEFPQAALDDIDLTTSDLASIIDRLAPAGCRVSGLVTGTFTYITPSDYDSNNHDASKGYDGLDTNGDPKDNGGTYAGVV